MPKKEMTATELTTLANNLSERISYLRDALNYCADIGNPNEDQKIFDAAMHTATEVSNLYKQFRNTKLKEEVN
jgi:hypothetical protein